jgi:multidrug efflux pump subunit AcrB/outer membrane protein TolC
MNPIHAALRNRTVVFVLCALAVLLGVHALFTMPRREDPRITIRTGLVVAQYPGASAEQVEDQVTRKIEERLFRHEEVRKSKTFSTSRDGIVVINVELEESVSDPDRFWAMLRHDMNELRVSELPATVRGPVVNSDFGDVVAVLLAVSGDAYTPRELDGFLDRIEDAIRTIRAVSSVKRHGEQREELRVSTSNARLAAFGLTPADVVRAVRGWNTVENAGEVDEGASNRVPIRAKGLFSRERDLEHLLIGASREGQPAYLASFATVERRFADPSSVVRVDGRGAILLSVEMQEGNNIVKFGEEVRRKLAEVRRSLPADLVIDVVSDQPAAVEHRMGDFAREFLMTLAAVILVTLLMLPLRIAAIAAVAIPVTVAITLAILAALGIELHQVTFAGLVVALGIVVDDAIVVADNYVEKLDHGLSPFEAAWRAPTELAAPVLAATLTIVASFLPLAFLPGSEGEFMGAMAYTVAIALIISFAIAMFLTPLLAQLFAKRGLRLDPQHEVKADGKKRVHRLATLLRSLRPLELMQSIYERAMGVAMARKRATILGAIIAFVMGVLLMTTVPYRFFPMNERDQFVIDVWMPADARLDGTDAVMRRLETELMRTDGVRQVATFVGQGAPRFYYNLNPEPPTPSYGQFLVRTKSPKATKEVLRRLDRSLHRVAPEAWVFLKPLQQGPVIIAPNEVRLVGENKAALRAWGDSVARIFEETPGSAYVHTDWRDAERALVVHLKDEVAGRLGISSAEVSAHLAAEFDGARVSTFWEGKRDLDITLRLEEGERTSTDDVTASYVISPVTGARVPVRQLADLSTEWRPSRIVHRNGVRTLTVRSFSDLEVLPSTVLDAARPRLAALRLPDGIRLEYGGELERAGEVQGSVNLALLGSLVAVFVILVVQFRNMRQPLVVMVSIPLAVVGAALGLLLTMNPFTYTANLGLNALTGMVVRNAIILVHYANELRRGGLKPEAAALLAGRRRLRPIFLTTMAAALGVTPMILSRSPLWSPMASVIAVGLVVSMIFTLVVVPVLYVLVERRVERRAARRTSTAERAQSDPLIPAIASARVGALAHGVAVAIALAVIGTPMSAQTVAPVRLTVDSAVQLALTKGKAARIAQQEVRKAAAHHRGASADYLPRLSVSGSRLHSSGRTQVVIPSGVLGKDGTGAPVPSTDRSFEQGATTITYAQLSLNQPLTTLYRVRQAETLAAARERAAEIEHVRAQLDIAAHVQQLFFRALIAQQKLHAATVTLAARKTQLADAERAAAQGVMLLADAARVRANVRSAEYSMVVAGNEVDDLESELSDALDIENGAPLELVAPDARPTPLRPIAEYVNVARAMSPEVARARIAVEEAKRALSLARADYIPETGVGVTHTYQKGVAFLPQHSTALTIQGSWTIWDFGKRSASMRERRASLAIAKLSLERAEDQVTTAVEKAYRRANRASVAAAAAQAALDASRSALRIASDKEKQGIVLAAHRADAEATEVASRMELLSAFLEERIAGVELSRVAGVPAALASRWK